MVLKTKRPGDERLYLPVPHLFENAPGYSLPPFLRG